MEKDMVISRIKFPLFLSLAILAFGFIAAPERANAQTTGVNTPTSSTTPLYLGTQNNTYMTIGTNGAISLGPTSLVPTRSTYVYGNSTDFTIPVTLFNQSVTCANGGQWGLGVNGSSPTTFSTMPSGSFWIHQDCAGAELVITHAGNVGIGVQNPTTMLNVAQNNTLQVGQAYLSSGGDYANLSNNEWYNGSSWVQTAAGALIQLTAQSALFYSHTASGGGHALMMGVQPWVSSSGYTAVYFNGQVGVGNSYNILSSSGDQNLYLNVPSSTYGIYLRYANNNMFYATSSGVYAPAYFHTSDTRLKTDIKPVDHALDKVLALQGVTFNWKKDGHSDMGVTAQNVESVFPNAVSKGTDGMMSVNYDSLIGPMIEAIRELNAKNEKLEAEIADLKKARAAP
jgi:Chaperone of endosialidase